MKIEAAKPGLQAEKDGVRKRKYVKPEFRHEAVFETMALLCGKLAGTSPQCNSFSKLS